MQNDFNWVVFNNDVFIEVNDYEAIIYNTANNKYIFTSNLCDIKLISEVKDINNLNVILVEYRLYLFLRCCV